MNSSEIVDGLRTVNPRHEWFKANGLMEQAASHIEAQAKLIEELREALKACADRMDGEYGFDGPELERAKALSQTIGEK